MLRGEGGGGGKGGCQENGGEFHGCSTTLDIIMVAATFSTAAAYDDDVLA
jgi:hypothetical protein